MMRNRSDKILVFIIKNFNKYIRKNYELITKKHLLLKQSNYGDVSVLFTNFFLQHKNMILIYDTIN